MGAQPRLRTKPEVDAALLMIEKIKASGTMGEDVYHKCIVSLAYEYICADEQQEGLVQLARVPPSYYENVQLRQAREDKGYADLVVLLSYKLIQMGVVEGSEKIYVPTMAPARA
jgi:hypothetical protein